MPLIETDIATGTGTDRALLDELIRELKQPRDEGQPIIEIKQMKRGLRHVHVIWDKWDGCLPEVRADIIRQAFTEVKDADYERSIAITIAATVPEARDAGLFPWSVKPYGWSSLTPDEKTEVRQVLVKAGASTLGDPALPELRFPTEEEAGKAAARLRAACPKYDWNVAVTVNYPS